MGLYSRHIGRFILTIVYIVLSLSLSAEDNVVDSLVNQLLEAKGDEQYDKMAELGLMLINEHYDELAQKEYSPHIFSYTATALSTIGKYAAVPELAKKGYPLVQKFLTKRDVEYYALPCCEIVAYLIMYQPERADSVFQQIKVDLYEEKDGPARVKEELPLYKELIDSAYDKKWSGAKSKHLNHIRELSDFMPGVPACTEEGATFWKEYLELLRNGLASYYLDTQDKKDEEFWNYSLATLLTYFTVCCENLPGREEEAYDNILVTKNFMDYHLGKLHKTRMRWRDVQKMLDDGEAAIELTAMLDDVLILRKDVAAPICVRIDSTLIEQLVNFKGDDALEIDDIYKPGGPLTRLWNLLEPALDGVRTIYLSASYALSKFNYGAITTPSGQLVEDRYDYHYLVSTADIAKVKATREEQSYRSAVLFGDVCYDTSADDMMASAKGTSESSALKWDLTRGMDEETRGSYRPLKHSKEEIDAISKCLEDSGVETKTFKGISANEEAFKSLSYSNPDIIHVSTHGFMLAQTYVDSLMHDQSEVQLNSTKYATTLQKSGLLLSGGNHAWKGEAATEGIEDGILTSGEIADMNLQGVKLVVLSACKSGLGNDTNLTGVSYGPQHALKAAGAGDIVMSLWMVDDEATALLMQHFYQNLTMGNNVRTALKIAQRQLIEDGYIEPFYWAAFVVLE